jgi:hypothetical protein
MRDYIREELAADYASGARRSFKEIQAAAERKAAKAFAKTVYTILGFVYGGIALAIAWEPLVVPTLGPIVDALNSPIRGECYSCELMYSGPEQFGLDGY